MGLFDDIVAGATSVYNNVASAVSSALSSAGSAASQVGSTAVSAAQQAAQAANVWGSGAISGGSSLVNNAVNSAIAVPSEVANFIPTSVSTPISFTSSPLSSISDMGAQANPVTYLTANTPSIVKTGLSTVGLIAPAVALPALVGSALVSSLPQSTYKTTGQWAEQLLGPGGGAAYAKATDVYAAKQTTVPSSDLHSSLAGYNGGGADWSPLLIPTYDTSSLPAGTTTRSDYYSATQAGDATTQARATELASKPYLVGTVQPFRSYGQAVGVALEAQRETTTGHAQSYYTNELEKLVESNVGISSEYHYNAMASGVQTAANPYEYLGDLSVEFLKGTATKGFSPVSGEIESYLPASRGLQDWAWSNAEGKGTNVSYLPALAYLASAEGIEGPYGALYGGTGAKYVSAGDVSQRLSAWSGLPRSASVTTVMPTQVGASEPATVMKTSGEGASVLQPSGFDLWAMGLNIPVVSGALVATSDFLLSGTNPIAGAAKTASSIVNTIFSGNLGNVISGKSSLSPDSFSRYMATTVEGTPVLSSSLTTVGEPTTTVRQLADGSYETTTSTPSITTKGYTTPISTTYTPVTGGFETVSKNYAKEIENILPSSVKEWYNSPTKTSGNLFVSGESGSFGIGTDYTNAFLKGALKGAVEDPLTLIMNVAVGAALAGVGEGLASYGTEVVASTEGMGALSTVAKSANWAVNTGAPIVLGGLYATDVAGRSTSWGTDFTPTAAQKLGVISSTEAGPMILGGVAFANRGAIAESIRTSNVGDYFSNFKTTLSGEPGVSIETRPVALSDITGTKSTSIDPLAYLTSVKTSAVEGISSAPENLMKSVYRPSEKLVDVYDIKAQTVENVFAPSGTSLELSGTKLSQKVALPSINVFGKDVTIPFSSYRPVGGARVSALDTDILANEYSQAVLSGSPGLKGDLFSQQYITRESFPTYDGYIKGEEVVTSAQAIRLGENTEEYARLRSYAETSTKTPAAANAMLDKLLTDTGLTTTTTKSIAFGKPEKGVTLSNVWERGQVITEAPENMISARINKIGDISPFVLSSEQTLYGISAGKVEGLKIESVRRVPSVSETGISTYESDMGDYFTREISPGFESDTGRNIIAEGKTARASEFINKQLGSSFPAKGKPVIGESQAIIQNALNRIAIQGDLSANMGRVKELQYGYQEFAPIKETRQYKGGGFYPQVTLSTPGSRWNDLETLPDYMKSGRGNINAVERGVSESTPVSYGGAKNLVSEAMRMDEIGDLATSAPKPASTSKAKVRIEEEEPEYYREVPGMKRPASSVAIGSSLAISQMNRMLSSTLQFQPSASSQKQAQETRQQQESRQKQSQVSWQGSIADQMFGQKTAQEQRQEQSQVSWQGSIADQMFGQKTAQEQRQEQRLKSEQVSKQDTSSALDRITGLDTRQALRTTQRTRQDITTDITTEIVPDLRIRIKTDKIIIPGIPDLGGFGPSGGGSNSGFTFTEKLNVVSRRQALIGDRMDTMTGLGKASNSKKFKMF